MSQNYLADAVERLRGKVRIIIQRGRLAKMRRTPRIAAVLDQFVREVDFDEATHSWHPKTALVRTRSVEGDIGWRLWIGSRNLTECVNRDIGLLLTSGAKGGSPIPGADELARALADRAALKGVRSPVLATTIAKVAWRAPAGVRVERIAGMGLAQPSEWDVRDELESGKLVLVPIEGALPRELAIWAVFPSRRQVLPKLRVFLDKFQASLA